MPDDSPADREKMARFSIDSQGASNVPPSPRSWQWCFSEEVEFTPHGGQGDVGEDCLLHDSPRYSSHRWRPAAHRDMVNSRGPDAEILDADHRDLDYHADPCVPQQLSGDVTRPWEAEISGRSCTAPDPIGYVPPCDGWAVRQPCMVNRFLASVG